MRAKLITLFSAIEELFVLERKSKITRKLFEKNAVAVFCFCGNKDNKAIFISETVEDRDNSTSSPLELFSIIIHTLDVRGSAPRTNISRPEIF